MSAPVRARIEAAIGGSVSALHPLHGGDIAQVWRVDLADGRRMVAKHGHHLDLEAWMLRYLRQHSEVPVPDVHHAEDDLLVMSFVPADGRLEAAAEMHLADVVAALHGVGGRRFGLERDTLIGGLPQPNPESDDWCAFFRDHRLLCMAGEAQKAGRLPARLRRRVDALAGRLETWVPRDSRPALIHGDLWGGNILARGGKVAALIDPAIYHADPEIELAFATLFNSVGPAFFARYNEHRPLRPGFFEERRDLYNLYPLLVHVRLFGGAYVAQVERTLARYGC